MQQRDSFNKKSKKLFNRTLHSLKHLLLFDGYQKLHKSSSFRAFSCASCRDHRGKAPQTEESYPGFSGRWPLMEVVEKGGEPSGSIIAEKKVSGPEEEGGAKKEEKINPPPSSMRGEGDGFVLARKMKELEMMEVGDMEHVLDIEEALHYYSRLTSPVYAGIVDKFFMDMYSDFSPSPAPPAAKRLVARDSRRRRAVVRPWR